MCGLCLPHCPTYVETGDENESPRGRIALLRALADGALAPSDRLAHHISQCLSCRACERVCPAGVQYGQIIDAGRQHLASQRPAPMLTRLAQRLLLDGLIARPQALRRMVQGLRLYQRSGLARLAQATHLVDLLGLGRWQGFLPALPAPRRWPAEIAAQAPTRGRVSLFLGCVASAIDRLTLESAVAVLTRLGYTVTIPPQQTCCGALHWHQGQAQRARMLMRRNLSAFGEGDQPIVYLASGCGTSLRDYASLLPDTPAAHSFSQRAVEIHQFLRAVRWPDDLPIAPLAARVAVHDPCSLRHTLRAERGVYEVLARIPRAQILSLPENQLCCGGAGSYPLREPAMAERLRRRKLAHIAALAPDVLVSANIGCALQLAAGMREAGLPIEVLHPITLLARQLKHAQVDIESR